MLQFNRRCGTNCDEIIECIIWHKNNIAKSLLFFKQKMLFSKILNKRAAAQWKMFKTYSQETEAFETCLGVGQLMSGQPLG